MSSQAPFRYRLLGLSLRRVYQLRGAVQAKRAERVRAVHVSSLIHRLSRRQSYLRLSLPRPSDYAPASRPMSPAAPMYTLRFSTLIGAAASCSAMERRSATAAA